MTRKTNVLSNHNKRKLSVLIPAFNQYLTSGEIAKRTFQPDMNMNFKEHKRLTQKAASRLCHEYDHPYLIKEVLQKNREGGKTAYKCTDKGRRVACELTYRTQHGLDLNWKRSKLHFRGGKGQKKWNKYNIRCSTDCENCRFNPIKSKHIEGDVFPARRPSGFPVLPSPKDFSVLTPPL